MDHSPNGRSRLPNGRSWTFVGSGGRVGGGGGRDLSGPAALWPVGGAAFFGRPCPLRRPRGRAELKGAPLGRGLTTRLPSRRGSGRWSESRSVARAVGLVPCGLLDDFQFVVRAATTQKTSRETTPPQISTVVRRSCTKMRLCEECGADASPAQALAPRSTECGATASKTTR